MSNFETDVIERLAEAFKALSNPYRLSIFLRMISRCPPGTACAYDEEVRQCVGDVGKDLGISRSTVSHHVKELRRAGLIRVERCGKNSMCGVDEETVLLLVDLLTGKLFTDAPDESKLLQMAGKK